MSKLCSECPFLQSCTYSRSEHGVTPDKDDEDIFQKMKTFLDMKYKSQKQYLRHNPTILFFLKILTFQCTIVRKSVSMCGNGRAFARLSSLAAHSIFEDLMCGRLLAKNSLHLHKQLLVDYMVMIILRGSSDVSVSFTLDFCLHEVLEVHRKMRAPWNCRYVEYETFDDTKHFLQLLQNTTNRVAHNKVQDLFHDIFLEYNATKIGNRTHESHEQGSLYFKIPPGIGDLKTPAEKTAVLKKPNAEMQKERLYFLGMLTVVMIRSKDRLGVLPSPDRVHNARWTPKEG